MQPSQTNGALKQGLAPEMQSIGLYMDTRMCDLSRSLNATGVIPDQFCAFNLGSQWYW